MNSNKIVKGFAWTAIERFSIQFVQFILGIIIARLITPAEYGVLGILMVFINISQVFIDSGLGSALIYYNNSKKEDVQTTFTFNLGISTILFIILYFVSPYLEIFFHLDHLSKYMQVSALVLFTNSLIVVPTALLKIRLDFRSLAISNLTSTVLSGILGVLMAYLGYGVWALIGQLLSKSFLQFILLFTQCRWVPCISFHKESFKRLYNYGIKIFSASCITKIIEEGTTFFIGKILTPFNLGIYTRSNQFASLPATSLGTIVSSVLFPSLSSLKNDTSKFNDVYINAIKYQGLFSIPLFLWLAMICEPMIKLLLTEKWIAVVPVLQILSIGRILFPVANITEQVLNAKGRNDLFLNQQMIKMGTKCIFILIALKFGLMAIAIAEAIYNIFQFFITNYYAKGITPYNTIYQLKLFCPFILTGFLSATLGYIWIEFLSNNYLQILLSLLTAIGSYYFVLNKFYDKQIFASILSQIKKPKNNL